MPASLPTRDAILKSIQECDRLTREVFLERYGFKGAKDYFLVFRGKSYDSKAILAVSHKFMPGGQALKFNELKGGQAKAVKQLRTLGFHVETPSDDPDWSWDEHVLALQLYMQNRKSPPGKRSDPILRLSAFLNELGKRTGAARTPKFRNANGVYMKLMNFRRVDPEYQAQGKKGLRRGAKLEEAIWRRYESNLVELDDHARAVYAALKDDEVVLTAAGSEEDEADEGAVVIRLHKARERNPELAKRKKRAVFKAKNALECEICGFDFYRSYGELGFGFIEAHHKRPLAALSVATKTRLSDLALVCSNCHRMLHRWGLIELEELRKTILAKKESGHGRR